MRTTFLSMCSVGLLVLAGCSRVPSTTADAASSNSSSPSNSSATVDTTPPPAPSVILPRGTSFRVRLLEAIDTRRNRAGDQFTASLDEPLVDGDRVVVPKGTVFTGHVIESKASGRFKGRAVLALHLDSFDLNGQVYAINSTDSSRVSKGHKKHNLLWIGGGSGGGALIGAAAGGGGGALIGAGAGAAAGTVGSALTGKREVTLPVESVVRFSLASPVNLS